MMRRFAAHLALAALYATLIVPFALAALESAPACCRRAGTHHCQTDSHQAGFHSQTNRCPYSTALPPASVVGLEPAKLGISSPPANCLLSPRYSSFCHV